MRPPETNEDAETLAIRALAWTLAEQSRAERLLALTGLDADELRARAGEPALLASVIEYLCACEPDLIACADELGVAPAALAGVAPRLGA